MVRLTKEKSSELQSPQSLENSVARVEQLLLVARRVAAEMERLKTGSILISNQPSFECALGDLCRWGKACEDALLATQKEMGYFRAAASTPRRVDRERSQRWKRPRKGGKSPPDPPRLPAPFAAFRRLGPGVTPLTGQDGLGGWRCGMPAGRLRPPVQQGGRGSASGRGVAWAKSIKSALCGSDT